MIETRLSTVTTQISREAFLPGMYAIAAAYWRELSDGITEVFYRVLGERMTDAEWERVVKAVLTDQSAEHARFPPTPGRLLAVLQELRDADSESLTPDQIAALDADGDHFPRARV